MNPFAIIQMVAALGLGGLIAAGVEEIRWSSKVDAARADERQVQETICTGLRQADAADLTAQALDMIEEAKDAAASVGRTPIDKAEIQDLCNSDPFCRDRRVVVKKGGKK